MCLTWHVQSGINLKSQIWKLLVISHLLWPSKGKNLHDFFGGRDQLFYFHCLYYDNPQRPQMWTKTNCSRPRASKRWKQAGCQNTHISFHTSLSSLFTERVAKMGLERKRKGISYATCPVMPSSGGRWGTGGGQKRQSHGNSRPEASPSVLVFSWSGATYPAMVVRLQTAMLRHLSSFSRTFKEPFTPSS